MINKAAIILSRIDSTRFPGKALTDINGLPLLGHCISALHPNKFYDVILATTDRSIDDPLAKISEDIGIKCFRGSTNNVAHRVIRCLDYFNIDQFARINGDSPFINKKLIEEGFKIMDNSSFDFLTNLIPRTFPYGMAVEIFNSKVFKKAYKNFNDKFYQEHITSWFYDNIDKFNPYFVQDPEINAPDVRLVIDTPEDKAIIERILKELTSKPSETSILELIKIYKQIKNQL